MDREFYVLITAVVAFFVWYESVPDVITGEGS